MAFNGSLKRSGEPGLCILRFFPTLEVCLSGEGNIHLQSARQLG